MKKIFNEGNQIHNFMSSSESGINYGSGSGSDFLPSYGSGYGSGSTSQKVTVLTVPVPVPVPQHCRTGTWSTCLYWSFGNKVWTEVSVSIGQLIYKVWTVTGQGPEVSVSIVQVADPDPEPDPHGSALILVTGSGSGSRRAKMTHKNRKKYRIFMFWIAG